MKTREEVIKEQDDAMRRFIEKLPLLNIKEDEGRVIILGKYSEEKYARN